MKKKIKDAWGGSWTIQSEVPSIEITGKKYELCFAEYKNDENFTPGDVLKILWVNRTNHTIGCVIEDKKAN